MASLWRSTSSDFNCNIAVQVFSSCARLFIQSWKTIKFSVTSNTVTPFLLNCCAAFMSVLAVFYGSHWWENRKTLIFGLQALHDVDKIRCKKKTVLSCLNIDTARAALQEDRLAQITFGRKGWEQENAPSALISISKSSKLFRSRRVTQLDNNSAVYVSCASGGKEKPLGWGSCSPSRVNPLEWNVPKNN